MGWTIYIWGAGVLILTAIALPVLWILFLCLRNKPGNERPYWASNFWLPNVTFEGQRVNVENIRNLTLAEWRTVARLPVDPSCPSPYHVTRSYDLDRCNRIWLCFSPYHAWISFEFEERDGCDHPTHLALSIEARFQYEGAPPNGRWTYLTSIYDIYWSLCTEMDILNRCMAQEKFPYPILMFPTTDREIGRSDEERAHARRHMLRTALERASAVAAEPENYNYMNNSCATNTMWLGNLALGRRDNKPRYRDGLRMALRHGETGMIRLCHDANVIDTSMVPGDTFDDVCRFGNITDQLRELTAQGVTGDELSYRLRQRFRDTRITGPS